MQLGKLEIILGCLLIVLVSVSIFIGDSKKTSDQSGIIKPSPILSISSQKDEAKNKPSMAIEKNKTYQAKIETTEGTILLELSKETPITTNNFVTLARKNFYNNVVFHRVIKGFMIQGGDPDGNGTGGPGYKFDDEPFQGEYTRGTLAMANAGPNTNGSQFFIMHKDTALPKNYVIFGKVLEGLDIVDKIAEAPVTGDKPNSPVVMKSVTIEEK